MKEIDESEGGRKTNFFEEREASEKVWMILFL
jgi:hypothetical protein